MAHKNIRINKMKPNLFVGVFLITTISIFISCENLSDSNSKNDARYITKFDVEEMARQYLVDFSLIRKHPTWNRGREYVFNRESNKALIFIKVGLHPSVREVEELVLDYLNSISMVMKEGPVMAEPIGDNLWWAAESSDSSMVTHILFIRKNAFISLHSYSNIDLKALAKSIDDDIMKGASYLTLKNSISSPIINSMCISKTALKEGETAKITINATDPEGEPLEYMFHNIGLARFEGDPENVFTLTASRDYISEPFFGSHNIKFVVINKSNVVSSTTEITVNITP